MSDSREIVALQEQVRELETSLGNVKGAARDFLVRITVEWQPEFQRQVDEVLNRARDLMLRGLLDFNDIATPVLKAQLKGEDPS